MYIVIDESKIVYCIYIKDKGYYLSMNNNIPIFSFDFSQNITLFSHFQTALQFALNDLDYPNLSKVSILSVYDVNEII